MGHHTKPRLTENEEDREYWIHQKVERGEKIWGEEAEFLDEMGGHGAVKQRREAWAEEHDRD